jgi:hypothetical protein
LHWNFNRSSRNFSNHSGVSTRRISRLDWFCHFLPSRRAAVRRRVKNLTLLEVLISLTLAAIILSALFQFVSNQSKVQSYISKIEERIMSEETAVARLNQLLGSKPKRLFTHEQSLLICCKQPLDPDPDFNGDDWSYLLVKEGNLEHHRYSTDRKKSRSETLFRNVSKVEWQFWDSPKWVKTWPSSSGKTPGMIRLKIKRDAEELEYAFVLDLTHPIVLQRSA